MTPRRNLLLGGGAFLLVAALLFWPRGKQDTSTPPAKKGTPSVVRLTRVIRLGAKFLDAAAPTVSDKLTMTQGGEDEEPDGPDSFDVLPDGGFVLGDPLAKRLAVYDSQGRYQREAPLGFAPRAVQAQANGLMLVEKGPTGEWFSVDPAGRATPAARPASDADSGRILAPDRAYLPGPGGGEGGGLPVVLENTQARLVSVEKLGADSRGRVYVALETSWRTDEVAVEKIIRKYAPDGGLLAEIRDIPLDYYVAPAQEFRLRDTAVYQLMPRAGEVRIHVWDTGSAP
jgi:hypothetical protein